MPILFLITLSFLLVHEMDAVRCREWTIFPLLSRLTDETGYLIFTAAHIPLIVLILAGLANGGVIQQVLRLTLDVFCLIHIILHAAYHRHPQNRFESRFSRFIILGAGLAGLLDLGTLFL